MRPSVRPQKMTMTTLVVVVVVVKVLHKSILLVLLIMLVGNDNNRIKNRCSCYNYHPSPFYRRPTTTSRWLLRMSNNNYSKRTNKLQAAKPAATTQIHFLEINGKVAASSTEHAENNLSAKSNNYNASLNSNASKEPIISFTSTILPETIRASIDEQISLRERKQTTDDTFHHYPHLSSMVGTAAAAPPMERSNATTTHIISGMGLLGDPVISTTSTSTAIILPNSPLPGTVLSLPIHDTTTTSSQIREIAMIRVATPTDDSPIASIRQIVFWDKSNPNWNSNSIDRNNESSSTLFFHQRFCEQLQIRRRKGAICLVAVVPSAACLSCNSITLEMALQLDRYSTQSSSDTKEEWVLGTVECSIHEFYGTQLGQCYRPFKVLYVSEVAVLPSVRRCGLGNMLLQGVDKLAFQMGIETIYLHMDVSNDIAGTLYKKAGYHRAKSHVYHDNFTRSLNLQDGAIPGRCHDLMWKHIHK